VFSGAMPEPFRRPELLSETELSVIQPKHLLCLSMLIRNCFSRKARQERAVAIWDEQFSVEILRLDEKSRNPYAFFIK
jgi:hypothetical protein